MTNTWTQHQKNPRFVPSKKRSYYYLKTRKWCPAETLNLHKHNKATGNTLFERDDLCIHSHDHGCCHWLSLLLLSNKVLEVTAITGWSPGWMHVKQAMMGPVKSPIVYPIWLHLLGWLRPNASMMMACQQEQGKTIVIHMLSCLFQWLAHPAPMSITSRNKMAQPSSMIWQQ